MNNVVFLFAGQGAQSVGMGRDLADSFAPAADLYRRANEILGYDLASICFSGPVERLNATEFAQPAIFTTSLAALEFVKANSREKIDACTTAAGLSLGEYTALVFAGALSFEEGLRLVALRGRAMQAASDAVPSGMVSILGLDPDVVARLCVEASGGDILQIANDLCPGNIVVSGTVAACERVVPLADAAGAMKTIPLAVAGAFHTPLMQPAADALESALRETPFLTPRIPVVSNVDGLPHFDADDLRATLVRQLTSPVRWRESMEGLFSSGYGEFFEVGPGRILRGLLKRIHRKATLDGIDML